MLTELQQEYAKLSDDELLHLAAERSSLTDEAKIALEAEMSTRQLTVADVKQHEISVRKNELHELHETRRTSRKLFGIRLPRQKSGVEILVAFFWIAVAISVILLGYFAVPARYRLPADWQEATMYATFTCVFLSVWFFREWGRRLGFWICLLISSTAHALLVHAWVARVGTDMLWRHRGDNKAAGLLGFVLFLVVYGCWSVVQRKFYSEQTAARLS